MQFALVNGARSRPFRGTRGQCPLCGSECTSHCGKLKVHHWSHLRRKDCDTWAENIGPWHVAWQGLVKPEYTEVCKGAHRADIVGNNNVVVELQSSPIPIDHISAREDFYGNMVWLFDATKRFSAIKSGSRVFFSLGRTQHIEFCTKPTFLDFGALIVEVEEFSKDIREFTGYGHYRSRRWFAETFLSEHLVSPGDSLPLEKHLGPPLPTAQQSGSRTQLSGCETGRKR
jgi:hypothetical protein